MLAVGHPCPFLHIPEILVVEKRTLEKLRRVHAQLHEAERKASEEGMYHVSWNSNSDTYPAGCSMCVCVVSVSLYLTVLIKRYYVNYILFS